jgi:protein-tyrosine phosphatase
VELNVWHAKQGNSNEIRTTDDLMNPYKLNDYEWYYLEKLTNLLERFNHWTSKISVSTSYATIYNKLMDNVEDYINANNIDDISNTDPNERQQYDELLKNLVLALRTTNEKIRKYYSTTNIYAVTTAMDCRMKFHW